VIDLVWITRISDEEDRWLEENLAGLDKRYNVSVVGHTKLDPKKHNFRYYEYWDNGKDEGGLICHKKNIGAENAQEKYCLMLHSDVTPKPDFYDLAVSREYDNNTAVAPYASVRTAYLDEMGQIKEQHVRSFTWCDIRNVFRHKDFQSPQDNWTYISGAGIFAQTELFKKYKWNETLSHGQEEDLEYSLRLTENGVKLVADEYLMLDSRRSQ